MGEADGLTWDEVQARYALPDWDMDPVNATCPGESHCSSFYERCVERARAYRASLTPTSSSSLVVHGGVIEQAMKLYQGLGGGVRLRPRIENCSMTEIEFYEGAKRLLRYNDLSPIGVA